mmetsp:Transcript_66370/g.128379  ORF Transcript_66370/g.128379 Transcript_66370/m.128379 type:complete len:425 (+) Transcript_66370:74-1348(+)
MTAAFLRQSTLQNTVSSKRAAYARHLDSPRGKAIGGGKLHDVQTQVHPCKVSADLDCNLALETTHLMPELQKLQEAVDEALRAEEIEDLDEPESELPTGEEVLEEEAMSQQPTASQVALRKTWRLACLRGQQVQRLSESLASAQESTASRAKTGSGSDTESASSGSTVTLAAARRAAKAKDWELSRAQERIEGLERAASEMEQKLLVMERAKQREAWLRGEAQRNLSALEAETARASMQRDEFRKRLLAAKQGLEEAQVALEDAREEVLNAERRREETRTHGERRAADLEAELTDSKRLVAALQHQLQEVLRRQLREVGSMPRRANTGGVCRTRCQPVLESVSEEEPVFHDFEETAEKWHAGEEDNVEGMEGRCEVQEESSISMLPPHIHSQCIDDRGCIDDKANHGDPETPQFDGLLMMYTVD